jgi:hypothetical protein
MLSSHLRVAVCVGELAVEALWKHAGTTRSVANRQQQAQLVDPEFYGESNSADGLCLTTGFNNQSPQPPDPLRYMRAPRIMGLLATRKDARSVVMSETALS